jgi:hypothetical protein
MCVTHCRAAVLSIITGGGKWVEITIPMDPLYLSVLVSAEKKFRRCVQSDNPRSRLALGRLHGPLAAVGSRPAGGSPRSSGVSNIRGNAL